MTGRQAQMMPTQGSTKARSTAAVSSPGDGVGQRDGDCGKGEGGRGGLTGEVYVGDLELGGHVGAEDAGQDVPIGMVVNWRSRGPSFRGLEERNLRAAENEDGAEADLLLQRDAKVPEHRQGQDEDGAVHQGVDGGQTDQCGHQVDAFVPSVVPDRMHRPALKDGGEEAGDGPAYEDAGYGVEGVFEVRVVGREDAAVEQEDAELGAAGAEWVDGFEDVEGSAGANGIGGADADDVLPEAIMCACRVIIVSMDRSGGEFSNGPFIAGRGIL